MDINKYSKTELSKIIKLMKKYRTLKKNIGRKSYEVIHAELTQEQRLSVEYFPEVQKNDILVLVKDLYKDVFGIETSEDKIIWKENPNLRGGLRLFFGDELMDVSFESVENKIRKI
ncbi:MAG: hypothetical protein PHS92_03470 [Candidatus Gracilibacteria bacterium]|nr:hypothetical protein [Candidatus Gracilibacteria bacterium]